MTRQGLVQIVRPPSHSRRAEAARVWARRTLLLSAAAALVIVPLMFMLDAAEVTWMPPRGTAWLWPLRVITDFGKSSYILIGLFVLMMSVLLLAPRVVGSAHGTLAGLAARLQYLFCAVLVSVVAGEVLKGIVGRGRPLVGGAPNAFNYSHFSWSEAYASFPSGHATASCALAFAVSALWPRLQFVMIVYAAVIIATRLVLLAHHPSDVVGGALIGVLGAMLVRYWFAARRVVFVIRSDGGIVARCGAPISRLESALRASFAR